MKSIEAWLIVYIVKYLFRDAVKKQWGARFHSSLLVKKKDAFPFGSLSLARAAAAGSVFFCPRKTWKSTLIDDLIRPLHLHLVFTLVVIHFC